MTEQEFRSRAKRAALAAVKLISLLPRSKAADHFGGQLLRSSSSVACNYRAACRARSDAEMASKLGVVEEEADESQFWMEMLVGSGCVKKVEVSDLHREFGEILAMTITSRKTLRSRIDKTGSVIREPRKQYQSLRKS